MKKLVLGEIPGDFDFNSHIAITPMCFSKNPEKEYELKYHYFVDPCPTYDQIEKYDKIVAEEAIGLVKYFAKKFNPNIYYSFSNNFWKTIYFPTLYIVISVIRKHILVLDEIKKKYINETLQVDIIENANFYFESIENLWSNFDILLQEKIFSYLIECNTPENFYINKKSISNDTSLNISSETKLNYKSLILKSMDSIFHRSKRGYGINLACNIYLHLLLSFKKSIKYKPVNFESELKNGESMFDSRILDLITALIPEDEKNITQLISKLNKKKFRKGKISLVSNTLFYSLYDKIFSALKLENKEIVVSVQHGGHSYGSAKTLEFIKNIEFSVSGFFSWGWNEINGVKIKNIIKIDSPFLSLFIKKYRNNVSSNKFILVGTIMPITFPRFECNLASYKDCLQYRDNKIIFLDLLNKSTIGADVYYRPYAEKKYSFKDLDFCLKKIANLNVLSENLHEELLRCKLLILDHPGTTWNLAYSSNIPTILFWNPNHFILSNEAKDWLLKLKNARLYFENPKEAAEFILKNEISTWWYSPEIQEIRKEWVNVFARSNTKWLKSWTNTLLKLDDRTFIK